MNCQDFEPIILSMARAQLLEASARRQTLAHIAQCPDCADRLADQQTLSAAVRATAKSIRHEEASASVEHSLRTAFRKQASAATANGSVPAHTRQWPQRALAAAAAVLLLALLAGAVWQWSRADRKQKLATAHPTPSAPKERGKLPERLFPADQPGRDVVKQLAREPRRRRHLVRQGAAIGEENITDFISLASASELTPLESGQVLRVELSTSTLISMGLPIPAEDMSKPVLADLLVGQDGLARAIRFVQPGQAADSGLPQYPNNK